LSDQAGNTNQSADAAFEETVSSLTGFLRSETRRAGRERLVLGLSGGIDSALAAYLAARAIGAEKLHCVLLPYRSSSEASIRDALAVVEDLGAHQERFDISPLVDAFVETAGEVDRIRLGNVMARARMTLLFDRSEEHRGLVLGTSNKTELLLGYGTLHGDLASSINPLGDLYKAEIRALAAKLGVPEPILRKKPSADLWPGQSDEEELGFTYDEVDRLLALLVHERATRQAALDRGYAPELVDRVTRRIVAHRFKFRIPIIARVRGREDDFDFPPPADWRV